MRAALNFALDPEVVVLSSDVPVEVPRRVVRYSTRGAVDFGTRPVLRFYVIAKSRS